VDDGLHAAELRALWDFADPAGSEAVLRAAADGASTAPVRQAELLTQVARALGLQERFDEAHLLLDALAPLTPVVATRVLLERGRLFRSAGDLPAAVSTFEAAMAAAGRAGLEGLQVDALHMLAVADQDRSAVWTKRGLDLVASSQDPEVERWSVALHNNHAWSLMELGRPADALAHFEAAHAAAVEVGTREQEQIARWAVARCLRELGRVTEALEIQRALAAELPDDPYVQAEIAALESAIGRAD
jgi:tetratricopeptide (TPR) repeat protein